MGPKLIKERLLRTTGDGLSWNRVRGLEKQEVPAPLLTFLGKEDRLERRCKEPELASTHTGHSILRHSNAFFPQGLAKVRGWEMGKRCWNLKSVPGPEELLSRRVQMSPPTQRVSVKYGRADLRP